MFLNRLFRNQPDKQTAWSLYGDIVNQARNPVFYHDCGLPDSLDGRFDMIVLHVFIVLRRLKKLGESAAAVRQDLVDVLAEDMDRSLREMGVGDLGVGKRVRVMMEGFRGRMNAYEQGLAADGSVLGDAIRRNLFGTVSPTTAQVSAMSEYLRRESAVDQLASKELLAGRVEFGPPPEICGSA